MTDDRLEKVRAKVVRMHNLLPVVDGDNISVNYADRICTTLEMYIDSLQEEPISEELEEAAKKYMRSKNPPICGLYKGFKACANWQKEQFEKNRLAACDRQTEEEAEREQDFVMGIIENEHRQPTFDDAIKYGMRLQKEQMMKDAVEGFVKAEYQDVVYVKSRAIAGEERKKLGLHLCAKIKLIIIKEN